MPDSKTAAAPAAPRKRTAAATTGTTGTAWSSSSRRPRPRRSRRSSAPATPSSQLIGHIRDLPRNAADVPASHKGEAWARLGVDVDHDFQTLYVVSADKKQQVAKLKALLKDADELFLATDEDREGEAIAWHLLETLKPKVPVRRMVFHEITPQAIQAGRREPARARHRAGRRAGDPARARPAVRLRGQPGPVEEGHAAAVGRPRAVGGDPDRRGARAGPDAVRAGRLLGPRRRLHRAGAGRPHRAAGAEADAGRPGRGAPRDRRDFEQETARSRAAPEVVLLDEAERPRAGRAAARRRRAPCARSRTSRTPASRTRRS